MFHRRRHTSSGIHLPKSHAQPPPPPNAAAASAATQAFMKTHSQSQSLSAAAAATALRSHPNSPTSVGDVITKRIQRKSSTSSLGSSHSQSQQRQSQTTGHRPGSAGSMTDRIGTLRSPSPGRSPTRARANTSPNRGALSAPRVPPVPALPKASLDISTADGRRPRASSLDPPNAMRSSTGDGAVPKMAQSPRLTRVQEASRENSRRSINFSRPISPQLGHVPPPVGQRPKQTGWFTGPVVSGGMPRGMERRRYQEEGVVAPRPKTSGGLASSRWSTLDNGPTSGGARNMQRTRAGSDERSRETRSIATQTSIPEIHPAHGLAQSVHAPPDKSTPQRTPVDPANALGIQHEKHVQLPKQVQVTQIQEPTPPKTATKSTQAVNVAPSPPSLTTALRHEPPNRSASPAKSALKHTNGHVEETATEAPSRPSIETKRKKSVRINVDVKPGDDEETGVKSSRFAPPTPIKASQLSQVNFDDEIDDLLSPRPALPSFGSVRGQHPRSPEVGYAPASHRTVHDEYYASGDTNGRQGLLAGKGARREDTEPVRSAADPLPPVVTSVEGTGEVSDDDYESPNHNTETVQDVPATSGVQTSKWAMVDSSPVVKDENKKLEPPRPSTTPTPEEKASRVPGAFPDSSLEVDQVESAGTTGATSQETPATYPYSRHAPPEDDSSSEGGSVYSDAAEELDEHGFASLAAVLEKSAHPDSPKVDRTVALEKEMELSKASPASADSTALERRLDEARMNSVGQARASDKEVVVASPSQPAHARQSSLNESRWSTQRQTSPPRKNAKTYGKLSKPEPTPPTLTRSDSAGSASSFQRTRASTSPPGRLSFRRSMRDGRVESPPRNISQRTQSPPGGGMRASLRGPGSADRTQSPSKWRSTGSRISSLLTRRSKEKANRRSSRFSVDSDDEGMENRKRGFVSRFAGDSDEELNLGVNEKVAQRKAEAPNSPALPVVRGIPKRNQDDGDSTELEGENSSEGSQTRPMSVERDQPHLDSQNQSRDQGQNQRHRETRQVQDQSQIQPEQVRPVQDESQVKSTVLVQDQQQTGRTSESGPPVPSTKEIENALTQDRRSHEKPERPRTPERPAGQTNGGLASSKHAPSTPPSAPRSSPSATYGSGHRRWHSILTLGMSSPSPRQDRHGYRYGPYMPYQQEPPKPAHVRTVSASASQALAQPSPGTGGVSKLPAKLRRRNPPLAAVNSTVDEAVWPLPLHGNVTQVRPHTAVPSSSTTTPATTQTSIPPPPPMPESPDLPPLRPSTSTGSVDKTQKSAPLMSQMTGMGTPNKGGWRSNSARETFTLNSDRPTSSDGKEGARPHGGFSTLPRTSRTDLLGKRRSTADEVLGSKVKEMLDRDQEIKSEHLAKVNGLRASSDGGKEGSVDGRKRRFARWKRMIGIKE